MVRNALKIDGWMPEPDLLWLSEMAKDKTLILEIGSWKGRSSRALGDNCNGKVVCIDHWTGSVTDGYVIEDYTEVYSQFITNNLELILSGKIVPINLNSELAYKLLSDIKFDMIFIDGAHDYTSVNKDISMWKNCLDFDGLISGHDILHEPVKQAVTEHFGSYKTAGDIWYI